MLSECSFGRFQYLAFALCVLFRFLACRLPTTNMCTVKQCTFNLNCAEHLATMPARLCFIRSGSQTVCLHSVYLLGGVEIVKAQEGLMVSLLPSSFITSSVQAATMGLCVARRMLCRYFGDSIWQARARDGRGLVVCSYSAL